MRSTLAVVSTLAYEAWASGRAQQVAAERALREYARFAALTYRQRVQARLYTTTVGVLRSVADPRGASPNDDLPDVTRLRDALEQAVRCRCGPALEATTVFRVRYADRDVSTSGSTPSARVMIERCGWSSAWASVSCPLRRISSTSEWSRVSRSSRPPRSR